MLIELFKRVKYHKKINASNENLAYWIFRNFKYHNEKLKQYVDFNIDYISEVMRKIDKEPNYDELILTDLLKYKSKDDRKNYLV